MTGPTGPTPQGTTFGNYLYWNGTAWVVGSTSVLLGANAGQTNQATGAVAIGYQAGNSNQSTGSVAIGYQAGYTGQNAYSVALGYQAGFTGQGTGSVAIGYRAGYTGQAPYSIAINAGPTGLNPTNSGLYVSPIRAFVQTSPPYTLSYSYSAGGISGDQYEITATSSDRRLKTDISDTQLGLDFINALRPVEFRWKDKNIGYLYDENGNSPTGSNPGTRLHEGFIAQEVKAVLEAQGVDCGIFMELNDGPDSIKGLNALRYDEFIGPMVKAIQQQQATIQTLQEQNATQQATIQSIQDQLVAIQKQLNPSP
jgi:hypothetical protein